MEILYLYSKIMPYQIPVIKQFVFKYKANVHIVYWDQKGNAPYVPPSIRNVTYYKKSESTLNDLTILVKNISPNIIFISGWQDKDYLKIVKPFKKNGVPIVCGFDDIWYGNLRQRIGSIIFPYYLKNFFSHAWVSGPRQYEFAKKLGFKEQKIYYYLYSGDTELFERALDFIENKKNDYPKTFLFVGRFVSAKAIDVLVDAYEIYKRKYKGDWKLICVGAGYMKNLIEKNDDIIIYDFLNQEKMLELINDTGVFILPSRFDVSPLVVHEFCSAGLPIILSDCIGNRLMFLIEEFNGLSFDSNSAEDLANKMNAISQKTNNELIEMSYNSNLLSKQHNAKFVAASFISILRHKKRSKDSRI